MGLPEYHPSGIHKMEIRSQIKFKRVIRRLHVLAQLIERLVMLALLEMRQFVYDDQAQKFRWRFAEDGRHADFML